MSTLAAEILELSRMLSNTVDGVATAGSTTTLGDTTRHEPDDYFDKGTLWFITGNLAGKSVPITQWVGTTFSFATQAAAAAAADRYAVADRQYPRWLLIQAMNVARRKIGLRSRNTALTTVDLQESYTLPAGVYNLIRVEIANELTSPYDFTPNFHWEEMNGTLLFTTGCQPQGTGFTIRITYLPRAADLTADTDVIEDQIPRDALLWEAKKTALQWRIRKTGLDEPDKREELNEALQMAEQMLARFPILDQDRDPRLAGW